MGSNGMLQTKGDEVGERKKGGKIMNLEKETILYSDVLCHPCSGRSGGGDGQMQSTGNAMTKRGRWSTIWILSGRLAGSSSYHSRKLVDQTSKSEILVDADLKTTFRREHI